VVQENVYTQGHERDWKFQMSGRVVKCPGNSREVGEVIGG